MEPVAVVTRSNAWVYGLSLAGVASSNPVERMEICVDISETGRSLVQRSPTECGVSECVREAAIMSKPSPTGRVVAPLGRGGEGGRKEN